MISRREFLATVPTASLMAAQQAVTADVTHVRIDAGQVLARRCDIFGKSIRVLLLIPTQPTTCYRGALSTPQRARCAVMDTPVRAADGRILQLSLQLYF